MELDFVQNGKVISILGFMSNLSAGGVGLIALGEQAGDLAPGTRFNLTFKLGDLVAKNVEGKVAHVSVSPKAKAQKSKSEWIIGLAFTKLKPEYAKHITQMAEDKEIYTVKNLREKIGLPAKTARKSK